MAAILTLFITRYFTKHNAAQKHTTNNRLAVKQFLKPTLWVVCVVIAEEVWAQYGQSVALFDIAIPLLIAWAATRYARILIPDDSLYRFVSFIAWGLAILHIAGLLRAILEKLAHITFLFGGEKLDLVSITQGIITIIILVWLAFVISRLFDRKLSTYKTLEPSLVIVFGKLIKILLIIVAVLIGFSSAGINMSTFAVFGGAIGVGIGFGLQKVVSNLICGVIILLDRSIKPGDVIGLYQGRTYGWVNKLGARCISVRTRDGEEHLIPNEDIITQRVESWSYSDTKIRLKLPIGIGYYSDLHLAMKLLEEAPKGVERVLSDPPIAVRLLGFGDNSVNLELRVWIRDPESGVENVESQIRVNVWDLFHKNDITLPFPQRDLHFDDDKILEYIRAFKK